MAYVLGLSGTQSGDDVLVDRVHRGWDSDRNRGYADSVLVAARARRYNGNCRPLRPGSQVRMRAQCCKGFLGIAQP